jgi:hypothetical protein
LWRDDVVDVFVEPGIEGIAEFAVQRLLAFCGLCGKMAARAPASGGRYKREEKGKFRNRPEDRHDKGKKQRRKRNTRHASEGGPYKPTATASPLKR